jgi:hypothetical protein
MIANALMEISKQYLLNREEMPQIESVSTETAVEVHS